MEKTIYVIVHHEERGRVQIPVRGVSGLGSKFLSLYGTEPWPEIPILELDCRISVQDADNWALKGFVSAERVFKAGDAIGFVQKLTAHVNESGLERRTCFKIVSLIWQALRVDDDEIQQFWHPVAAERPLPAPHNKTFLSKNGYNIELSWVIGRPFLTVADSQEWGALGQVLHNFGCRRDIFDKYVFPKEQSWYSRSEELLKELKMRADAVGCEVRIAFPHAHVHELQILDPDGKKYVFATGENNASLLKVAWDRADLFLDRFRLRADRVYGLRFKITAETLVTSHWGFTQEWVPLGEFAEHGLLWEVMLPSVLGTLETYQAENGRPVRLVIWKRSNLDDGETDVSQMSFDDVVAHLPLEAARAVVEACDRAVLITDESEGRWIIWSEPLLAMPFARHVFGVNVVFPDSLNETVWRIVRPWRKVNLLAFWVHWRAAFEPLA